MPNLQNAKKALRQSKRRALRNKVKKEAFKQALKKVKKAVEAGTDKKEIMTLVAAAQKTLDKAAKHGIIKQNTASRHMSRMMKRVNAGK